MTSIFWTADTNIDRAYRWPRVDRSQDSRWASEGRFWTYCPCPGRFPRQMVGHSS